MGGKGNLDNHMEKRTQPLSAQTLKLEKLMPMQQSRLVSGHFAGTWINTICLLAGLIALWVAVIFLGGRPGMAGPQAAARSQDGVHASNASGARTLPERSAPHGAASPAATARLAKAYGNLPMTFEPNQIGRAHV